MDAPKTEAPARPVSGQGCPAMSHEDEELLRFGKEVLESRRDCVVVSLESEMTSLRRGVRTYEAAQINPGDPNRSAIEASRYANSIILKEEADKLKDSSREEQARELSTVYIALARANLKLAREETGSHKAELVDFAKCGFVKYVSLQAILDEMGTDRSKRQKISWAPGIEV
jgi:hypothetical protein